MNMKLYGGKRSWFNLGTFSVSIRGTKENHENTQSQPMLEQPLVNINTEYDASHFFEVDK